jgi:hypothetical protein
MARPSSSLHATPSDGDALSAALTLRLLEHADQFVGVFLLHREDSLEHAFDRRVLVADVLDHLAVAVDRDALGDQVFLDHVDQVLTLDVLGVAARGEALGRGVRLALQSRDARRDLVGVLRLLVAELPIALVNRYIDIKRGGRL